MGEKRYIRVLHALLTELTAMPETDAVLFFGSVQRGQAQATSDLDLYVVTSGTEYWRAGRVLEGVEIELFFNPASKMRERLEQGDPVAIHGFATGELLLDRSGVGAKLKTLARALWAAGPRPLTEWQMATWRYRLTDLAQDIE
ncbi:MAG: nucleotidyltransferase domain-containing protein, partial [Mycobacterium leprae]